MDAANSLPTVKTGVSTKIKLSLIPHGSPVDVGCEAHGAELKFGASEDATESNRDAGNVCDAVCTS